MVCYNSSMTIEKPQTFNQINQQISVNYRNGSEKGPTVLVPRGNSQIAVAEYDPDSREVMFTGEDGLRYTKPVLSLEAVSDQHQEMLAAELGASRGDHTEVLPSQRRESVPADLAKHALAAPDRAPSAIESVEAEDNWSETDREALDAFARHAKGKRNAQLDGDGYLSRYHSERVGDQLKNMSARAQQKAYSYAQAKFGADNVAF